MRSGLAVTSTVLQACQSSAKQRGTYGSEDSKHTPLLEPRDVQYIPELSRSDVRRHLQSKVKFVCLDELDILILYLNISPWEKALITMLCSYCVHQGHKGPMAFVSEQCLLSRPQPGL